MMEADEEVPTLNTRRTLNSPEYPIPYTLNTLRTHLEAVKEEFRVRVRAFRVSDHPKP